jgi:hypothetical protein
MSFLLCSAVVALLCSNLAARQIQEWPYNKLFKHADLVIIAKPVAVRDAEKDDHATPPKGYSDYLTGVVTSLEVLHVVKGEYKLKKLDLTHFQYKKGVRVANGPMLVEFHTKDMQLSGGRWSGIYPPEYMLFLKKGKDGRMEPVSGQVDPRLSVKQIMGAFP